MPTPRVNTQTHTVGSHTALIQFGQSQVPIGFLASFRKAKHTVCEGGRGFVLRSMPGQKGKANMLCECALPRAQAHLRAVGAAKFSEEGAEWLGRERARIEADEARCRQEGYDASQTARCPYPDKTDQALAWVEGHARREEERKAAVPPVDAPNEPTAA